MGHPGIGKKYLCSKYLGSKYLGDSLILLFLIVVSGKETQEKREADCLVFGSLLFVFVLIRGYVELPTFDLELAFGPHRTYITSWNSNHFLSSCFNSVSIER